MLQVSGCSPPCCTRTCLLRLLFLIGLPQWGQEVMWWPTENWSGFILVNFVDYTKMLLQVSVSLISLATGGAGEELLLAVRPGFVPAQSTWVNQLETKLTRHFSSFQACKQGSLRTYSGTPCVQSSYAPSSLHRPCSSCHSASIQACFALYEPWLCACSSSAGEMACHKTDRAPSLQVARSVSSSPASV